MADGKPRGSQLYAACCPATRHAARRMPCLACSSANSPGWLLNTVTSNARTILSAVECTAYLTVSNYYVCRCVCVFVCVYTCLHGVCKWVCARRRALARACVRVSLHACVRTCACVRVHKVTPVGHSKERQLAVKTLVVRA